jgi:hypothetical protein
MTNLWPAIIAMTTLLVAGSAIAQDAPNLVGKWTGTFTGGVRQGGGQLAPANQNADFVKPGEREYTLTVEKQDGRGFMGSWGSVLGSEPMLGVIRLDNRTLLMVDSDSSLEGAMISPTEIEFCNHTVSASDHFAFCFLLKKQ